tara:strand:- start:2496 stop:2858 length:363 start_codon:yes stop_codon:yes gene_type:complete
MKEIRKFLVKHFVLDYTVNLFGRHYNAPRASRIIYPLMVITGFISGTNPDWPTPTLLIWALYLLVALALFLGFVYFRFYPVKWEELDKFQKFQYGHFPYANLTKTQYQEWLKIRKQIQNK